MAYLFRLPGNTSGVLVQYSPHFMISILLNPSKMLVTAGGELIETSVPKLLMSHQFDNWRLTDYDSIDSARVHSKFFINEMEDVPDKISVRPYRLGNVAKDAKICWGSGNPVPYDLRQAARTFWGAPFNSDLVEDLLSVVVPGDGTEQEIIGEVRKIFSTEEVSDVVPVNLFEYPVRVCTFQDQVKIQNLITDLPSQTVARCVEIQTRLYRSVVILNTISNLLHYAHRTLSADQANWLNYLNAMYTQVSNHNSKIRDRYKSAVDAKVKLSKELLSVSTCECFDCKASIALNKARLEEAEKALTGADIEKSKEFFEALRFMDSAMTPINDQIHLLVTSYAAKVKTLGLKRHIGGYTSNFPFQDGTAYYAGKLQIAVPVKADAVFYSLDQEDLAAVPKEYHRRIYETPILLGFGKLIVGSSYLIDLGGHIFMYDTKNRKISSVPKEILEPLEAPASA